MGTKVMRSCRGSVDNTWVSQPRSSWFESACHGSCPLRQGTLFLASPLERTKMDPLVLKQNQLAFIVAR